MKKWDSLHPRLKRNMELQGKKKKQIKSKQVSCLERT